MSNIRKIKVCKSKYVIGFLVSLYAIITMDVLFFHIEYSRRLYYGAMLYRIALVPIIGMYIIKNNRSPIIPRYRLLSVCSIGILYIYCMINNYGSSSFTITTIANVLIIIFFLLFNRDEMLIAAYFARKIIIIIMGLSIIVYAIHFFRLPLPYTYIQPTDNWDIYQFYYNYHGILLMDEDRFLLRLCGIFNEPGVVGTMNAFFLCMDGYDLRKKGNIILLISGLLSLSAAFFILSIIALSLKFIFDKFSIKKIIIAILTVVTTWWINGFLSSQSETYRNLIINKIGRMITSGKSNRVNEDVNRAIKNMVEAPVRILFGYGYKYVEKVIGTASISRVFCNLGILGFFLWALGYLIVIVDMRNMCERRYNHNTWIYILVFIISLYQRPYLLTFSAIFMLITGILSVDYKKMAKRRLR